MNPVAIDTDAFLRARPGTRHLPDGSGHNAVAMWWRVNHPTPGATWHLCFHGIVALRNDLATSGPAVVDDFGDMVFAKVRP